jgi:hypothetical protein
MRGIRLHRANAVIGAWNANTQQGLVALGSADQPRPATGLASSLQREILDPRAGGMFCEASFPPKAHVRETTRPALGNGFGEQVNLKAHGA